MMNGNGNGNKSQNALESVMAAASALKSIQVHVKVVFEDGTVEEDNTAVEFSSGITKAQIAAQLIRTIVIAGGVLRPEPTELDTFKFRLVKEILITFPTIQLATGVGTLPPLRLQ